MGRHEGSLLLLLLDRRKGRCSSLGDGWKLELDA